MKDLDLAKLNESYQRLAIVGSELNKESDVFNSIISDLNKALQALSLGVSGWVDIKGGGSGPENYWLLQLGYTKLNGKKWSICIRHTTNASNPNLDSETWLWNEGPRMYRIEGVSALPALLDKLYANAQTMLETIRKKEDQLREVVSVLTFPSAT